MVGPARASAPAGGRRWPPTSSSPRRRRARRVRRWRGAREWTPHRRAPRDHLSRPPRHPRCAPQLVFGPASKIRTATATGSAPNRPDPAGRRARGRHTHRRSHPPPTRTPPASRAVPTLGPAPHRAVGSRRRRRRVESRRASRARCILLRGAVGAAMRQAEPGARPNRDGHTAAAQGVVPVDKDDALVPSRAGRAAPFRARTAWDFT